MKNTLTILLLAIATASCVSSKSGISIVTHPPVDSPHVTVSGHLNDLPDYWTKRYVISSGELHLKDIIDAFGGFNPFAFRVVVTDNAGAVRAIIRPYHYSKPFIVHLGEEIRVKDSTRK